MRVLGYLQVQSPYEQFIQWIQMQPRALDIAENFSNNF